MIPLSMKSTRAEGSRVRLGIMVLLGTLCRDSGRLLSTPMGSSSKRLPSCEYYSLYSFFPCDSPVVVPYSVEPNIPFVPNYKLRADRSLRASSAGLTFLVAIPTDTCRSLGVPMSPLGLSETLSTLGATGSWPMLFPPTSVGRRTSPRSHRFLLLRLPSWFQAWDSDGKGPLLRYVSRCIH